MNDIKNNRRMNILVIDDSASERALISAKLVKAGHTTYCAASAEEGIAQIASPDHKYDLILLDLLMPGTDGLTAARRIRAMEQEHGAEWLPIIFLSGRMDARDIAAAIDAGGDDYLSKSVDTLTLQAKLRAMQRIAGMRQRLMTMQKRLEQEANTDELTGIPNRRSLIRVLQTEMSRAKRHNSSLCLAFLDLDRFKTINDSFGHQAGDQVIAFVAKHIDTAVRTEDFVARLDGERLCLCMPGVEMDEARLACERHRQGIEKLRVPTEAGELQVTASVGITQYQADTDSLDSLMKRADAAQHVAKKNGSNRTESLPTGA